MTAAVIERDGCFLVTRRLKGTHSLAIGSSLAGKCDDGRSARRVPGARDCRRARRRAIDVGGEIYRVAHTYPERIVELHFFRCELIGEPQAVLGQEMRWVPRAELDNDLSFHLPTPSSSQC